MTKRIILLEEGTAELKERMGPKAAGLADLVQAGWPVPAGFVVTGASYGGAYTYAGQSSCDRAAELADAVRYLEQRSGKGFGHAANPLLLAVRFGETRSGQTMPAPLLHIGLNDSTVEGLAKATNQRMYALHLYRNLLLQFGRTVRGITDRRFDEEASSCNIQDETELEWSIVRCKKWIEMLGGAPFPQSVEAQLEEALYAMHNLASESGDTAANEGNVVLPELFMKEGPVLVQAMVYDGLDIQSGRGMLFTRSPVAGRKEMQGFYLASFADGAEGTALEVLSQTEPDVYQMLLDLCGELEQEGKFDQAVEFVVEFCQLHVLQASRMHDPNDALVKILVEMVNQGSMTKSAALRHIKPDQIPFYNSHGQTMLRWADEIREQAVFAQILHPREAGVAQQFGADGAVCRIEEWLHSPSRWPYVQKWIQANNKSDMWRLLPMLQADLEQVFEAMDRCPVIIPLLDKRWIEHQLSNPEYEREQNERGQTSNVLVMDDEWFREWTDMQLEAVFRATLKIIRHNWRARPELVLTVADQHAGIQAIEELADDVAAQILGTEKQHCRYRVGHDYMQVVETDGLGRRFNLYYGLGLDHIRQNETNVVSSPVEYVPFARIAAAQAAIAEDEVKRLYLNGDMTTTA